jgi:bacteriocin-like protein
MERIMSNVNDTSNLDHRDNSKNEADKLTTNESSLTTNELNQVVGGMGPVFLSLMTAPQPQKYLEIKNQDIVISS